MSTCRPSSVGSLIRAAIPEGWRAYLFGSALNFKLDTSTSAFLREAFVDVDILVVYPRARWRQALKVRHAIWRTLGTEGITADVVLLNFEEEAESCFAEIEGAISLV